MRSFKEASIDLKLFIRYDEPVLRGAVLACLALRELVTLKESRFLIFDKVELIKRLTECCLVRNRLVLYSTYPEREVKT